MSEAEKLFYTIGEASEIVQVKPYVLRYWEGEFKVLNPQKSETGQRTYRKKDIQVALAIKKLLYDEKYTIAGAIQKLSELEKEGLSAMEVPPPQGAAPETKGPSRHLETPSLAPAPSPQKMGELRGLIQATHAILKKYQLV